MENLELKNTICETLKSEAELLDKIIEVQKEIHEFVLKRKWLLLEEKITKMNELSSCFAELDKVREELEANHNFKDFEVATAKAQVKSRLLKSKLQNKVLNEYIFTTKNFLQGIFDQVLPERRNVTYSRYGKIVKPELHNVVLDQIV